jgi:hypothetical protein
MQYTFAMDLKQTIADLIDRKQALSPDSAEYRTRIERVNLWFWRGMTIRRTFPPKTLSYPY